MLGTGLGGIEQATIDYAHAMQLAGIECLTITQPHAAINTTLDALNLPYRTLKARSKWDILAAIQLRRICKTLPVATILTHGNRALSIALLADRKKRGAPIIGVAHNSRIKQFTEVDGAFAPTETLARNIRTLNPTINVAVIPNSVRAPESITRPAFRTPPTIGCMGRLEPVKGIDDFIHALAILRDKHIPFRAIIGGDGSAQKPLESLVKTLQLSDHVKFTGWVTNKSAFMQSIDIFALPSRSEAFGIALIEAMAEALPVIATACEGPNEIITHESDGILTKTHNPTALADGLARLIASPETATTYGLNARKKIIENYSLSSMSKRLMSAFRIVP